MGHKVSMSSCTCSCNEKPEAWTCGSRTIWAGCTGFLVVLGIVLIVVAIVSGGCSCASECAIGQPKDHCNSYFGGCEKGDYDSNKCVAVFFARGDAQIACGDASCKMGGLDANLMWALIIIGIICFVISCAFCCGICPCLCFLNTNLPAEMPAQDAVVVAAPVNDPGMKLEDLCGHPPAPPAPEADATAPTRACCAYS